MPDPVLRVDDLRKRFGDVEVLKGVSLTLDRGEVVALLGPSGSGKTTILRAVAGLERPDGGRITVGDRAVYDGERKLEVPTERRGLGLVFQSYALWPHRTVFDNVAYGLKLRRVPAAEIKRRVEDVLARLNLGQLTARYPHQLSGGQQQRVALARALVYNPPIILLDEPLSNLDAKLREEARAWLRDLILRLQLSALYVTHDQIEALSVADRVLLLQGGAIEQAGTPTEIYESPATRFAAEFMGSNNRLPGEVVRVDGERALLRLGADGTGGPARDVWGHLRAPKRPGEAATGLIRLERVRVGAGPGPNHLQLPLETDLYAGERWEHVFALGDTLLRAWGPDHLHPGDHWVELPAHALWIY
jgi:iron(III) transport system ATP-binding protein